MKQRVPGHYDAITGHFGGDWIGTGDPDARAWAYRLRDYLLELNESEKPILAQYRNARNRLIAFLEKLEKLPPKALGPDMFAEEPTAMTSRRRPKCFRP